MGTFEFAVYYFLTTICIGFGEALAVAMVIPVIFFVPPILIALLVFGNYALNDRSKFRAGAGITATDPLATQPPPSD